jgi:hypothetical protein
MYRTSDPVEEYEPAASLTESAMAPDALIVVGSLSLVMATLIVSCHVYQIFQRQGARPVFGADDKLVLTYFYAVIVIFVAVVVF